MFKSTKSQFAIRKLTQGAVAVLLTFGIFANTTSGIVSAAANESSDVNTTQIENNASTQNSIEAELTSETAPESTTDVQASNIEQSTEVETANNAQSTPVNSETTQNAESVSENTQVETATEINKTENTDKQETTVEDASTNDVTTDELHRHFSAGVVHIIECMKIRDFHPLHLSFNRMLIQMNNHIKHSLFFWRNLVGYF
ncbi:hypothetical protein [Lactobacillus helveticus]|uniref:hypothetical protein n=1 Tax=Lactobacillus helveticus TaxID=1587 RepID=UPI00386CD2FA